MNKQITFRATRFEDVATRHRSGETAGFVSEWPTPKYDKTFEPRRGYSALGELGTWTTTITALASSSAFAGIVVAWLKSRRRKITLTNGNRTVEYEGPNPVADLELLKSQIENLVGDEKHPTIHVYTEDLDNPPPKLEDIPKKGPLDLL